MHAASFQQSQPRASCNDMAPLLSGCGKVSVGQPTCAFHAGTLREVSRAALLGFTEVWDGLEDAGRVVLVSARDNTAQVVRQRYGEDAAEATTHSMNTAGHSADAVYAVRKIGVKTVAKSAAKRTAKGVIQTWAAVDSAAAGQGASSSAVVAGAPTAR